jgi:hypothetical protein
VTSPKPKTKPVKPEQIKSYPATMMVHTASGPTPACHEHAEQIARLFRFLGSHVNATVLLEEKECSNCVNEAKSKAPDVKGRK